MNIPGFTAELSLHEKCGHYRSGKYSTASTNVHSIVPQGDMGPGGGLPSYQCDGVCVFDPPGSNGPLSGYAKRCCYRTGDGRETCHMDRTQCNQISGQFLRALFHNLGSLPRFSSAQLVSTSHLPAGWPFYP